MRPYRPVDAWEEMQIPRYARNDSGWGVVAANVAVQPTHTWNHGQFFGEARTLAWQTCEHSCSGSDCGMRATHHSGERPTRHTVIPGSGQTTQLPSTVSLREAAKRAYTVIPRSDQPATLSFRGAVFATRNPHLRRRDA